MQHKGWTMAFKVICYFYFPSIIKKKNLCCCKSTVSWKSPAGSAFRIYLHFQAKATVIPDSLEPMTEKWPVHSVYVWPLWQAFLLWSSTLSWSRHCPIDITMKAVPAYSWFLFPFLFWILKPHHTLKTFFVQSCFLSLLSFMGIPHKNFLHS